MKALKATISLTIIIALMWIILQGMANADSLFPPMPTPDSIFKEYSRDSLERDYHQREIEERLKELEDRSRRMEMDMMWRRINEDD